MNQSKNKKNAFHKNGTFVGVINADALVALQGLPSDTFHTVVTSPPYFWARDYGDDDQIGHEDSPEEYVEQLIKIFNEVKRVLHPEGVFYLNIGDTYYSGNGQPHGRDPRSPSRNFMRKKFRAVDKPGWDIPKKSLIGIPWQVAFAMQKQGWTLRSDIIWNRINAFVEPTARDRPYRQYEHIFLFSKNRFYSYDRSALGAEEDVWTISIKRGNEIDHSAAFPRELVKKCLLTGSPPGGYILDPFLGSGTTINVALDLGRHAIGIELNAKYVQEVEHLLMRQRCNKVAWSVLENTLCEVPDSWKTWKGNRANFRKPGTGKTLQTSFLEE